jgi:Glycosyltransferases involved in cell wall biogenesis
MIVKNEEKLLARAVTCFNQIADEIIIVDTGSTDKTRDIAAQYTDKVYDFDWCSDFSAAKNYAASKATMDYIYFADADEVIDEANRRGFMRLKEALEGDIDIVQMKYSNQLYLGTTYNFDVEYRPKLYKRFHEIRWVDPIHEVLDTKIRVFDSDVVIVHMPERLHAARDLAIYRSISAPGKMLPVRLHRLYARELFFAGTKEDFLRACEYFEWTLHEQAAAPEQVKASECVVARCSNILGDSDKLFMVSLKNFIGAPSAEVCCELGDHYLYRENYEEAATWYYTAAFGAESELNIHYCGDVPLKKLSDCYLKLGEPEESEKYGRQAEAWAAQLPSRPAPLTT